MAKIFTNEFVESLDDTRNYFERKYIEILSTKEDFKSFREKLEKIILTVPENIRQTFINKIRSYKDTHCLSAISELIIFEGLNKEFNCVEFETRLEQIDGKTPDFWVDKSIAFEVATIFEQLNPFEYELAETLNKIHNSNIKVMLGVVWNIPPKSQPKLKRIKKYFEELFKNNQNIKELTPFFHRTEEGIILRGYLYKGDVRHQTVGRVTHSYGFREDDINYKKIARKRIQDKLRKYKKLSDEGFPVIVVIFNRVDWILSDEKFWDETIFGDIKNNRRTNILVTPDKNTSLSAVIVRDSMNENGSFLIKNPFAKVKIDHIQRKIEGAFKTKEINCT